MTVSSTNQDSSSSVIAGRGDGIGQDRLALDVDALRRPARRRWPAGRLRMLVDGVLDVVQPRSACRPRGGIRPVVTDVPSVTGGGDVLDAGDVGDRVLDALGDLRLELARRRRPDR